jgi:hypothetical protein
MQSISSPSMSSVDCTTTRSINELPDTLLQSICSFLPPTTHLLFAVAVSDEGLSLTAPPPPNWQPSSASRAIISTMKRDTIDFSYNDMTLVEKLTDDDIASVLWCMDAVNNLKQLRLY